MAGALFVPIEGVGPRRRIVPKVCGKTLDSNLMAGAMWLT